MKLIVDLEKKSLRILENERSIFRGEYGADKLELYINKTLENEYPTITALLSNGRKIGPYSTDSAYSSETIDGVAYTVASFTLSKENGFTLSEGKMQITIWMNSNGKKEAIGNVLLNVINTTAFDDGDIIISGDVEGTLVNYRVELENLGNQTNTFNGRLNNVETNKADKSYVDTELNAINNRVTAVETNKLDKKTTSAPSLYTTNEYIPTIPFGSDIKPLGVVSRDLQGRFEVAEPTADPHPTSKHYVDDNIKAVSDKIVVKSEVANTLYGVDRYGNQTNFELDNGVMISGTIPKRDDTGQLNVPLTPTGNKHATSKKYVDDKIANLINGAPSTLDTLKELADALKENEDVVNVLEEAIGNKADKSELFSGDYNDLTNKPNIPTALSDLNIDVDLGVNAEQVMEIVESNSQQVETLSVGTSNSYNEESDSEIPTTKAVKSMIDSGGGGDNIKTVEIQGEWDGESFIFEKELNIDIFKNIRIDININNLFNEGYVVRVVPFSYQNENDDYFTDRLLFYSVEDGSLMEITDLNGGYTFQLGNETTTKFVGSFSFIGGFYEYNENNNVTLKLTYVEANELTPAYYYEY